MAHVLDADVFYSDFPQDVIRAAKATFEDDQEEHLKHHPDVFVRLQVAKNKNTPLHILEELSFDLEYVVSREAVQKQLQSGYNVEMILLDLERNERRIEFEKNHYSTATLRSSFISPLSKIRLAQAQNPLTQDRILEVISDDFNWQIRLTVFNHPNANERTKRKALATLKNTSRLVQFELANSVQTPFELLEFLHGSVKSERVKQMIELHPHFKDSLIEVGKVTKIQPTQLQQMLLNHGVYYLGFAYDWYLDEYGFQLRQFFDQEFEFIEIPSQLRNELENGLHSHAFMLDGETIDVSNRFSGQHLLFDAAKNQLYLAGEHRGYDELSGYYNCVSLTELIEAANTTDSQKLRFFYQHPDECIRYHALKNPLTSHTARLAMMGDLSPLVALAARDHTSNTFGILENLRLVQALQTKDFSLDFLLDACSHDWALVRLACAQHPSSNDEILRRLLEDFNWEIHLAIYGHPNASENTKAGALKKLFAASIYARVQMAQHLKSPPELLKALDTPEQDEQVIASLSMNPNYGLGSSYKDEM